MPTKHKYLFKNVYLFVFLMANEIHFICGENTAGTDCIKIGQAIQNINSKRAALAKTDSVTKSPGKGGPVTHRTCTTRSG